MNNGWIKLHRKLIESDIWINKPSTWLKIWLFILERVSHQNSGKLKRGEGYFNFSQDKRLIGKDITIDMIKSFCQYARATLMIDTRRTTRGMFIKVINYNTYQDLEDTKTPQEPRENHERTTTI